MVLLLNLCSSYLWLWRLGFKRKKSLHPILDVDWWSIVFVSSWYLFLVLSATQSWKGSKRSVCFGPNIIIGSLSDQRYLDIDHNWRIDWDLVFHLTPPTVWFPSDIWEVGVIRHSYSWSATVAAGSAGANFLFVCFCFYVKTGIPPCSTSVTRHETLILTCILQAWCSNHWWRNIQGRRQLKQRRV